MKLSNEEVALHDKMAEKLPELIEEYFQRPEITSVGVSLKTVNDSLTKTLSYTFGVKNKLPLSEVSQAIPLTIFGCPTDVIELEVDPEPLSYEVTEVTTRNEKTDPLIGGISISANGTLRQNGKKMAGSGTLGVMVKKGPDEHPYMLTCAHVLAGVGTELDSDVCQQSKWRTALNYCHNCATLKDYYYENVLVPRGDFKTINVWLDGAIARKGKDRNATIGKVFGAEEIISGFAQIDAFLIGAEVRKSGITSDITTGNVTSITTSLRLTDFNGDQVIANNLVMIQGNSGLFSRPGDSGSAIFTTGDNPQLVGILGGATLSGSPTYASAADAILSKWQDLSF
ncbi:hypothetical protein PFY10_07260 [Chryseobacterium daecheongense]|uniref:hypothetical protein n=1 Tax=Chryseobacterium sp. LAM-KRS1 TaxID=2715754 RepID=UPI001557DEAE|nr:hypothetical protein [Chryseobacterium sp. LAM-KRS1]WBV58242.1 hypothetical protein PFY10_07260 [Chryseobacterium daecheongense]